MSFHSSSILQDLFSCRRQRNERYNKWNICWLAATHSEKFFRTHFNTSTIVKLNIEKICKKIINIVENENHRFSDSRRFNLHLSSQLMYGVVKIHQYQVKDFEKEIFHIEKNVQKIILQQKNRDDTFDKENTLEQAAAAEEPINLNFDLFQKDLNLLPDEDINFRLQANLPAEYQNFGDLIDDELENLQNSQKMREFFLGGMIRKKDDNCDEIQADDIEEFIKGIDFIRKSTSLTPQKRHPREISLEMSVETPTKRRRLSLEVALPIPEHTETVCGMEPMPNLNVKLATLSFSQMEEIELDLEPSRCVTRTQKKKVKVIDKEISLMHEVFRNWQLKTNIHCKKLERPLPPRFSQISAKTLLEQPSHFPMRWNSCLRKRFNDCITGPLPTDQHVAPELKSPSGIWRAKDNTANNTNLPSHLATLGITDIVNTVEDIHVESLPPEINVRYEDATVPDVATTVEQKPPDSNTLKNIIERVDNIRIPEETISLSIRDILAMLEVLWEKSECIEFTDLISPSTYSKEDASTSFEILLDLYKEEKVILQQEGINQSLKILKHK